MSADQQKLGRTVAGRYRLDALLGRGGYGSVYRGRDLQFERDVAVKLLDDGSRRTPEQVAQLRERFRREAMAAGRINHRCVVTIHDFGVPDHGDAFIVMEMLDGHDLAWEIDNRGPLMPDRVLALFGPMLEALGVGHDLGIVHKDLKPQNVFIRDAGTENESMCLVDFGVARVVHEDKLTMTGLIVGTPQYLAPEYITETLVTPRLDVYQIGLILVEALTGVPAIPHSESFIRSCNRHFTGELDIPEDLMSGPLGAVLRDALNPDHEARIADGHALRARLAEVDPRSIAFDFQETMKFDRVNSRARERGSLPMNPPIRPEQASAELERQSRTWSDELDAGTPMQLFGEPTERMDVMPFERAEPETEPEPHPVQRKTQTADLKPATTQKTAAANGERVGVRARESQVSIPAPQVRTPAPRARTAAPQVRVPESRLRSETSDARSDTAEEGEYDWTGGGRKAAGRAAVKIEPTESVLRPELPEEPTNRSGVLIAISVVLFVLTGVGFFVLITVLGNAEPTTDSTAEPAPQQGELPSPGDPPPTGGDVPTGNEGQP